MDKLLLIDDDREAAEITARSLAEKGYSVGVASSAEEGIAMLRAQPADCVLLDVMMPGMDGFEACRRIRTFSDVPVIFLTGRVSEDDKVEGLLLGGDDYIEKPYRLRELEARVAAAIRRGGPGAATPPGRVRFPPLEIDMAAHKAYCAGRPLHLSSQEFDVLRLLVSRAEQTVTYEQVGEMLWGSYRPENRRAVMMSVSRLRKKLADHPATARMIETVWGEGYVFRPPARKG